MLPREDSRRPGLRRRLIVALASEEDREIIYQMRHEVYACELAQHHRHPEGRLRDALDDFNHYIVAKRDGKVIGFVSITPPEGTRYAIDRYLSRDQLPFAVGNDLYEVRILTVGRAHRSGPVAGLLMYAALRWIEARGGRRILAMGRDDLHGLYGKVGLRGLEIPIRSGALAFELMIATVAEARETAERKFGTVLEQVRRLVEWRLEMPFFPSRACVHGGRSIEAVGDEFGSLHRREEVIDADVLDAWFPPAPDVEDTLRENLAWMVRTSPPARATGMIRAIARARGVPEASVVPGAGSSDLIFLALRLWLTPVSRVLLLDPMYGEYRHVLDELIGCRVDALGLDREDGYRVHLDRLETALSGGYDLVALVNPNNPTGRHVSRHRLQEVLERSPSSTTIWVDETYVDYMGPGESLEAYAAASENVVVCKSMSKVYALSGVRAAYLCAPPAMAGELRRNSPPWAVSLPAQLAAIRSLGNPEYYAGRYRETHVLRDRLAADLRALGVQVLSGCANFLLCELSTRGAEAAKVLGKCRARGLYLRELASVTSRLGSGVFRVAVKNAETNRRIVQILGAVLQESRRE